MAKKAVFTKRERDKIKKKLLGHHAELMRDLDGNEMDIDHLQDPKADDLDRAVDAGAMELLVALGDGERRELEEIAMALEKVDNGTYGKCEACLEDAISKPRLEALPTARLCVTCQEAEEKNQIPSYTRLRPRRLYHLTEDQEFSHPLMDSNDDK
jgi:DnaK suppressor protein